jgi:hypothetical protein
MMQQHTPAFGQNAPSQSFHSQTAVPSPPNLQPLQPVTPIVSSTPGPATPPSYSNNNNNNNNYNGNNEKNYNSNDDKNSKYGRGHQSGYATPYTASYPSSQAYFTGSASPSQYGSYAGQITPQFIAAANYYPQQQAPVEYVAPVQPIIPYPNTEIYPNAEIYPGTEISGYPNSEVYADPSTPYGPVLGGSSVGQGVAQGVANQAAGYQQLQHTAAVTNTADATLATCAAFVCLSFATEMHLFI